MVAIICLLIVALVLLFALFVTLDYQSHCIDDLERRTELLTEMQENEMMEILLDIQEMTNIRSSCTMLDVRKYVNKEIERIAQKKRTR